MRPGRSAALTTRFRASFIRLCLESIRVGHNKMLTDKTYQLDWEEDVFTNCLVTAMRQAGYLRDNNLKVNMQEVIVTPEIAAGKVPFKKAAKVDFKFETWTKVAGDEWEYFAEAKNLSEVDWTKSTGAQVGANYYLGRYIKTGIENYLTGRYPEGCLVGYVVKGEVASVVEKLNKLICNKNLPPRIGQLTREASATWTAHYRSDNKPADQPFPLIHLLLQLA